MRNGGIGDPAGIHRPYQIPRLLFFSVSYPEQIYIKVFILQQNYLYLLPKCEGYVRDKPLIKLKTMERFHNTDSEYLTIRDYIQTNEHRLHKPSGLWYSFGNDWINWCVDNDCKSWIGKHTYKLDVDMSDILVIETNDDLLNLFNTFNGKYDFTDSYSAVDWLKVSKKYKGCEIRNYHHLKWNNTLPIRSNTWLWGWDISSGCVWDFSAIKGFVKDSTNQYIQCPPLTTT